MFVAFIEFESQAPSGAISKHPDVAPDGACAVQVIQCYKYIAPPALRCETVDSIEY